MAETYDFPPDLRAAQLELHQARTALEELGKALPWSAEPMPGWTVRSTLNARDDRVVTRPASPGYTDEQKTELERLRERLLELSVTVSTHPFWKTVAPGQVVGARMVLKRVHEQEEEAVGAAE
ncbi:hypothetical protein ABZ769_26985 [Streptomyces olivoreticuli]